MHKFHQKNWKLKFKELEINIMKIRDCKQLDCFWRVQTNRVLIKLMAFLYYFMHFASNLKFLEQILWTCWKIRLKSSELFYPRTGQGFSHKKFFWFTYELFSESGIVGQGGSWAVLRRKRIPDGKGRRTEDLLRVRPPPLRKRAPDAKNSFKAEGSGHRTKADQIHLRALVRMDLLISASKFDGFLLKNVAIYSITRNTDEVLKSVPSMKTVLIS